MVTINFRKSSTLRHLFALIFVLNCLMLNNFLDEKPILLLSFANKMGELSIKLSSNTKPYRVTNFMGYFFIVMAMLLLTNLLPQYLGYLGLDAIELSENIEDESEEAKSSEEEKENKKETQINTNELAQYAIFVRGNIHRLNGQFHTWQDPSADIITPPPDSII